MNKKIAAITMAILLSSTGIITIALAQQGQKYTTGEVIIKPDIIPDPIRPKYPEVTVAYGVGLNKVSMETEPVVFLKIKYGGTTTTIELLPGDVDGDCDVDGDDLELFRASYGKNRGEPGYNPNADFDNNGKVDHKDLLILARNYGKTCPIPPIPTTINYLIVDGDIYTMTEIYKRYDWNTGTKIYQYEANDGSIMTVIIQHFHPEGIVGISAEFKDYIITFEPMYKYRPRITTKVVRPFPGPMEKVSEEIGINIEDVLKRPSEPIAEWLE